MSAYTEEEAKTKWCPFGRIKVNIDEEPLNRRYRNFSTGVGFGEYTNCLASSCMCWRWARSPHMVEIYLKECRDNNRPPFPPDTEAKGYCGLAGAL